MIVQVHNGNVRVHINAPKTKVLLTCTDDDDGYTRCLLTAKQAKAIAAELVILASKLEEKDE